MYQCSKQVKPGDVFTTTCINYASDDSLEWGLSSDQEMCINYVYYWPKVYDSSYCGYKACGSMAPVQVLTDSKPTSFGSPSTTCTVTDVEAATESPVVTDAEAVTESPVVTDAEAVTESPVVTDAEAATQAPGVVDVDATTTEYDSLFTAGFVGAMIMM